ncbi:hypothetical protein Q5752_000335 [Cryptotrichosporon argae]
MSAFFARALNPLAAKVDIVFDNDDVVDLLGGPTTGTGYSLPGHVVLAVPALPAWCEGRPREIRNLSVTMEGKSEYADKEGRYTPLRLHTATITLATPDAPLLIPAYNPSDSSARVQIAVAFDLRVPGWLPASHRSPLTNTSYGAGATATIGWVNAEVANRPLVSSVSSTSTFGMALRPRPRVSGSLERFGGTAPLTHKSRWRNFIVRRHRMPNAMRADAPTRDRSFALRPSVGRGVPLECVVVVPEWVDTHGPAKSLRVNLRVRLPAVAVKDELSFTDEIDQDVSLDPVDEEMTGLHEFDEGDEDVEEPSGKDVAGGMRIVEIGMDVEETERFASTVTTTFSSVYPLPDEQPSTTSSEHALLDPHPLDPTLPAARKGEVRGTRRRTCLLAEDGLQRNFIFANDGLELAQHWRRINVVLPMPAPGATTSCVRPQPEVDAPFLRIRHMLRTRLVCTDADGTSTTLTLRTPIRFGTHPATSPVPARRAYSSICPDVPVCLPAMGTLPAYVQVFHENGEPRECDPLPVYARVDPERAAAEPRSPSPAYVDAAWPSIASASLGPSFASSLAPALSPSLASSLGSIASMSRAELAASLVSRPSSASPSPSPEPEAAPRAPVDSEASDEEGAVRKVPRTPRTLARRSTHVSGL